MPKISIVIPCFNMGNYLSEAVESVLRQSYRDFEIIIVDDASSDSKTRQLMEEYSHQKITVIRNKLNMGVAASRNIGIRQAVGEFILPLDADDVIADTYLEKAINCFAQRPSIGIVYCGAEFFGEKHGAWALPPFSAARMLTENLIFSAAFFRKSDWKRSGGFCPAMSDGWEDWDFWLSLISLGVQVEKIPDTLFRYRIRSDSRDRTITACKKVILFARLIVRHPALYLSSPVSFFRLLGCIRRLVDHA